MRLNQPVKKLVFAVIAAAIVLSGCGGPATSSMGGAVSLSSTSADTTSRIDASPQSSQANEKGLMTLEEVKAIFKPLLQKGLEVNTVYMVAGTSWPPTKTLKQGTVIQCGYAMFSLPYDYYLADDSQFGFDRFHSIKDLQTFTEEVYTIECAERAYYNRYLVGSDPKFIEYQDELYTSGAEGVQPFTYECDALFIEQQQENTIRVAIKRWQTIDEEPEPVTFTIKMVADDWRLDCALNEI